MHWGILGRHSENTTPGTLVHWCILGRHSEDTTPGDPHALVHPGKTFQGHHIWGPRCTGAFSKTEVRDSTHQSQAMRITHAFSGGKTLTLTTVCGSTGSKGQLTTPTPCTLLGPPSATPPCTFSSSKGPWMN